MTGVRKITRDSQVLVEILLTDVEMSALMTSQLNGCPQFVVFRFYSFLFELIAVCRLCLIYVREYNNANV